MPPATAASWRFRSIGPRVVSMGDKREAVSIPFSISSSKVLSLWGTWNHNRIYTFKDKLLNFHRKKIVKEEKSKPTCLAAPKQRSPWGLPCKSFASNRANLSSPLASSSSTFSSTFRLGTYWLTCCSDEQHVLTPKEGNLSLGRYECACIMKHRTSHSMKFWRS